VLLSLEAKAVGVGVHVHLWQQLQLGRGLPLHALRAHRIDAWQCTVPLREGWLKVPSASGPALFGRRGSIGPPGAI
jgi:hypothetical protein